MSILSYKTVVLSQRSRRKELKIEAPGAIINIRIDLTDDQGRPITYVSVAADGNRCAGDPEWWVDGEVGNKGTGLRIIRTTNPEG